MKKWLLVVCLLFLFLPLVARNRAPQGAGVDDGHDPFPVPKPEAESERMRHSMPRIPTDRECLWTWERLCERTQEMSECPRLWSEN